MLSCKTIFELTNLCHCPIKLFKEQSFMFGFTLQVRPLHLLLKFIFLNFSWFRSHDLFLNLFTTSSLFAFFALTWCSSKMIFFGLRRIFKDCSRTLFGSRYHMRSMNQSLGLLPLICSQRKVFEVKLIV